MRVFAVLAWAVLALPGAVRVGSFCQFGGSDTETVAAMARDAAGNLYVTGKTLSYDFPATVLQLQQGGSNLWRAAGSAAAPSPIRGHLATAVYSMAADGAHPGTIFLWSNRGLLRSGDYGDTWTANSVGLRATQGGTLAIDPRDGRAMYLATPLAGMFRSGDAGATWSGSSAGLERNRAGFYPDQVYADPANAGVLFATDGFDTATLYRSADAGASWQLQSAAVRVVVFDPRHAGVAYGMNPGQVLRSSDSGVTWSVIGVPAPRISSLAVDSAGNVYYSEPGFGTGVTVSRDGGLTWTNQKFSGNINALAADPDSPAVYAATDVQVLASSDGFATTSAIAVPPPAGRLVVTHGVLFAGTAASADAYVLKVDPSGKPVWSTYLGGSHDDFGTAIAVDSAGNVYVAGAANSPDFPSTPGALKPKLTGGNFVAKLSGDGRLLYSATFGEGGPISALDVDAAGNAYIAGTVTDFVAGGFFAVPVPHPSACKLDASGSQLLYCTKLGHGKGNAIAAGADGSAYLGGDSGLWKLSPAGEAIYQRDLKGTIWVLALDARNTVYAGGSTTDPDFPTTSGAFQERFNNFRSLPIAGQMVAYSDDHGFIARLSADSGEVLASTLLEGENWEHVLALAIDASGNIAAGGVTASSSFPLLGAFQTRFAFYTGFVARLTGDLSTLLFSTYVGDTRNFQVSGLAVAGDGGVFFAGDTSNASNFFSGTNVPAAGADIFVAGLQTEPSAPPMIEAVVNSASQVGTRIAPNQSITVLAAGAGPDAAVLLDGQRLPILASSPGRIVARIPADYPVTAAGAIRVQSGAQLSDPLLVAGATAAPAIYTRDGTGRGEALVFHEDGTLNSPDNPAAPGSVIAVACNGVGLVTFDGDYAVAQTPVSVYVDGFYANGIDAHMVQLPGIPGDTYLIRVYVPDPQIEGFKMPPLVSLTLNVGGSSNFSGILSQAEVAISIRQKLMP